MYHQNQVSTLGSMLLLLSPLLSFLLLPLDHLQPPQPQSTHIQLSLLSFGSMIWRWSQILKRWSTEFRITCNTSAHLFSISRHASTRAIVGTLGLFHFWEATRSPFLHRVLRLTPGCLLQLLLRHLLLLKIHTFRRNDPFSVDDKKGERDFVEFSVSFYFNIFIYVLLFRGHVVFGVWICVFYIGVLILWFETCFEVGMNLCMDKFSLWYHYCLWEVMLIFDTYLLCVVCGVCVCSWVSSINHPFYHLFWRLEVIGWLEETVCAYTFVILYS